MEGLHKSCSNTLGHRSTVYISLPERIVVEIPSLLLHHHHHHYLSPSLYLSSMHDFPFISCASSYHSLLPPTFFFSSLNSISISSYIFLLIRLLFLLLLLLLLLPSSCSPSPTPAPPPPPPSPLRPAPPSPAPPPAPPQGSSSASFGFVTDNLMYIFFSRFTNDPSNIHLQDLKLNPGTSKLICPRRGATGQQ